MNQTFPAIRNAARLRSRLRAWAVERAEIAPGLDSRAGKEGRALACDRDRGRSRAGGWGNDRLLGLAGRSLGGLGCDGFRAPGSEVCEITAQKRHLLCAFAACGRRAWQGAGGKAQAMQPRRDGERG